MDENCRIRPPTIKDVAREAGVSFKTVSRVINNNPSVNAEMQASVKGAMTALGYRPHRAARALRSNRSFTIALMCGRPPHLLEVRKEAALNDSPDYLADFLLEVIFGCETGARAAGYHLILDFIDNDDASVARSADALLSDRRADGILLAPPICDTIDLIEILEETATPFVRLMPGASPDRGLCVMTDDFAAGREIGDYLLGAGHREIAFVSGLPDHVAAGARGRGLESAIQNCADARIRTFPGDFSYYSGVKAARELLGGNNYPTAIFAANDAMAAGIINTAAELGVSIPNEVSVVGFDDATVSRLLVPKLTTVHQPVREMAMAAVAMLMEAMETDEPVAPRALRLPYQFIERASSAPANRT